MGGYELNAVAQPGMRDRVELDTRSGAIGRTVVRPACTVVLMSTCCTREATNRSPRPKARTSAGPQDHQDGRGEDPPRRQRELQEMPKREPLLARATQLRRSHSRGVDQAELKTCSYVPEPRCAKRSRRTCAKVSEDGAAARLPACGQAAGKRARIPLVGSARTPVRAPRSPRHWPGDGSELIASLDPGRPPRRSSCLPKAISALTARPDRLAVSRSRTKTSAATISATQAPRRRTQRKPADLVRRRKAGLESKASTRSRRSCSAKQPSPLPKSRSKVIAPACVGAGRGGGDVHRRLRDRGRSAESQPGRRRPGLQGAVTPKGAATGELEPARSGRQADACSRPRESP